MNIKFKNNGEALYIQLYNAIVSEISQGYIQNYTKLPSRRKLAEELNIAEITVNAAYKMLQDTGYAISIPRQGFFICFKTNNYSHDLPWDVRGEETYIFTANGIDKDSFPRATYAKIVKNIAYNEEFDILSHPQKNGEFALRNAISKYLYSFQNIKCSPWQIIVGAGQEYLITAFASIFDDDTIFAMEDSGYSRNYYAFKSYGKNIKTIPVGMDGLKIEDLYKTNANIFYATPYHHHPTCHKMTLLQKKQLLDWVSESPDRYIIEDLYDCELNWETSSESLYNLDKNNKVILLNTFSRSICSSFRTSYMLMPNILLDLWKQKHHYYYALAPQLDQYALAEFINKGHFVQHCKKMRKIYKERRETLKNALVNAFGDKVTISDNSDNVCVIATFNIKLSTEDILSQAKKSGVRIFSIKNQCIDPSLMPDRTFVFGIGELTNSQIKNAVQRLYTALIY